jgi:hypothetical protein
MRHLLTEDLGGERSQPCDNPIQILPQAVHDANIEDAAASSGRVVISTRLFVCGRNWNPVVARYGSEISVPTRSVLDSAKI